VTKQPQLYRINDGIWPTFQVEGNLDSSQQEEWQIFQDGMGDSVELFRSESDGSITGPFRCPKKGYSKMISRIPVQQVIVIDLTKRRFRISVPLGITEEVIELLVEAAVKKLFKETKPYRWHIEK